MAIQHPAQLSASLDAASLLAQLALALKGLPRWDPYLLWFLTQFSRQVEQSSAEIGPRLTAQVLIEPLRLSVLVELDDPNSMAIYGEEFEVWPSHLHSCIDKPSRLAVRPCVATLGGLLTLLARAAERKIPVRRIELCTARNQHDAAQPRQVQSKDAVPPRNALRPRDQRQIAIDSLRDYEARRRDRASAISRQAPARAHCAEPLVCVIDDLCNFASARTMILDGRSMVDTIWHQGSDERTIRRLDDTGVWSSALDIEATLPLPMRFSGALLGRKLLINENKAELGIGATGDEWGAYRRAQHPYPPMRASHGSVVLDLIMGRHLWIGDRLVQRDCTPSQVRFVQLPVPTVVDTSGGSLASHALDGIHHALEAAQNGQAVIVNLSYGTHTGPHDGTTIWDRGLKELLDRFDGSPEADGKTLHVVMPAGNSHRARAHASACVDSKQPSVTLRVKVQPDSTAPTFVEVWFPEGAYPEVRITPPGREPTAVPVSGTTGLRNNAFAFYPKRSTQGEHGTMLLLAIGASAPRNPPVEIQPQMLDMRQPLAAHTADINPVRRPEHHDRGLHGVWSIEVALPNDQRQARIPFHAWIGRGDAAPGRRQARSGIAGRQARFLDADCDTTDPRYTLNGIASLEHQRLWVIGSLRRNDGSISPYSAAGPNRHAGTDKKGNALQADWRICGPDVVAVADESQYRPGLLVSGVLSGSRLRVNGTSLAAAAFTRHLYEHLAAGKSYCSLQFEPPERGTRPAIPSYPCDREADAELRGEHHRLLPTAHDGHLSS